MKHCVIPTSKVPFATRTRFIEGTTSKVPLHNGLSGDHKVKNKSVCYEVESLMKQLEDYLWKVKVALHQSSGGKSWIT